MPFVWTIYVPIMAAWKMYELCKLLPSRQADRRQRERERESVNSWGKVLYTLNPTECLTKYLSHPFVLATEKCGVLLEPHLRYPSVWCVAFGPSSSSCSLPVGLYYIPVAGVIEVDYYRFPDAFE